MLLRKLEQTEKSRELREVEYSVRRSAGRIARHVRHSIYGEAPTYVKALTGLLLVPLEVVETGLKIASYAALYPGEYVQAVNHRLEHEKR